MNNPTNNAPPASPHGPYATERQAFDDAEPIYTAARRDRMRGSMTRANADALRTALSAAGVELGAYDQSTIMWVAGWEPQLVQVITGWVERANGGAR
jgi:hypothetical protein